jgi:hypothetical protein
VPTQPVRVLSPVVPDYSYDAVFVYTHDGHQVVRGLIGIDRGAVVVDDRGCRPGLPLVAGVGKEDLHSP